MNQPNTTYRNYLDPNNVYYLLNKYLGNTRKNVKLIQEFLQGDINNENIEFRTSLTYIPNTTIIHKNGLLMRKNIDYTESEPNKIIFNEPPSNVGFNDELVVTYLVEVLP